MQERVFAEEKKTGDRSKTIMAFIFGNKAMGDFSIFLHIFLYFSEFSTVLYYFYNQTEKKSVGFVGVRLCFKDQGSCLPVLSAVSKLHSLY